jgi:hypothetical protein
VFGAFSKSRERSRISEVAFQGAYKEFVNQIMMNEKNHTFNMEVMNNNSMREILESQWAMANIEYHFVFGWLYSFSHSHDHAAFNEKEPSILAYNHLIYYMKNRHKFNDMDAIAKSAVVLHAFGGIDSSESFMIEMGRKSYFEPGNYYEAIIRELARAWYND